ncbi:histidine phosphatase family protein [Nocardioides sp.]|uniref:SixA phosphatase family protein n=1 Tax=Nocardioides sp. TaxID=35761 RepID=UPI00260BD919|nr:histidine phosphatase family protein [Nocardioides sp.]
MTRTLVVVRHAKAEQFGPSDHERPLAERGLRDAALAGRMLAEAGIVADQLLVSTALRTRQTCAAISDAAGWQVEPWIDSTLYDAGVDTVLELLHALPEDATTAVVIGHNPTIAMTAHLLDDGTGVALGEFDTCAVAVFDVDVSWADVDAATCRLRSFAVPRA